MILTILYFSNPETVEWGWIKTWYRPIDTKYWRGRVKAGKYQRLYIGYANFLLNSQSVSFLQAYLLLELISSALLAGGPRWTGGPAVSVLWY